MSYVCQAQNALPAKSAVRLVRHVALLDWSSASRWNCCACDISTKAREMCPFTILKYAGTCLLSEDLAGEMFRWYDICTGVGLGPRLCNALYCLQVPAVVYSAQ